MVFRGNCTLFSYPLASGELVSVEVFRGNGTSLLPTPNESVSLRVFRGKCTSPFPPWVFRGKLTPPFAPFISASRPGDIPWKVDPATIQACRYLCVCVCVCVCVCGKCTPPLAGFLSGRLQRCKLYRLEPTRWWNLDGNPGWDTFNSTTQSTKWWTVWLVGSSHSINRPRSHLQVIAFTLPRHLIRSDFHYHSLFIIFPFCFVSFRFVLFCFVLFCSGPWGFFTWFDFVLRIEI